MGHPGTQPQADCPNTGITPGRIRAKGLESRDVRGASQEIFPVDMGISHRKLVLGGAFLGRSAHAAGLPG